MFAKSGPHIVNIELGTTHRKAPYTQILDSRRKDSDVAENQRLPSKPKHMYTSSPMAEEEEIVVDFFQ